MKKSNYLGEFWSGFKFFSISNYLYFLALGLAVPPEEEVRVD